jgi:uncharacterized protein (UPF0371 family)
MGIEKKETVERVSFLMNELEVKISDRKVVDIARKAAEEAESESLDLEETLMHFL